MPLMIGGLVVGVAGGIFGGMQKDAQAKAQYMAQKIQVERQNFQNALANDRRTEQLAQNNVNRKLRNEKLVEASYTNRFNAMNSLQEQTRSAYLMANMQANAAEATLESQITGKLGSPMGGTAAALKRQAGAARRRKQSQIADANFAQAKNIEQNYKNTLAQRDLLSNDQASVTIPGSTGIAPSSGAGLVNGLFSGISSGLALGSQMDSFGTKLGFGGSSGGPAASFVGPPAPGGG